MRNFAQIMVDNKNKLTFVPKFSQGVHDNIFANRVNPYKGFI